MATNGNHSGGLSGEQLKTLSTVLAIIVIFVTVASGYGALSQRLEDACARLEKVEARVEAFQISDTETKVQLSRIETDLAYIRTWIDKQSTAPAVGH